MSLPDARVATFEIHAAARLGRREIVPVIDDMDALLDRSALNL